MYKIYQSDKVIIIDSNTKGYNVADCHDVTTDSPLIEQTKLLQKLQNTKQLVLISEEIDAVFDKIVSEFRVIKAAGGVVHNPNGDTLMIYRLGKWDLPKGKLEDYEDIKDCAKREVSEECGVSELTIKRDLVTTKHLYPLGGEWILKFTYWFEMNCSDTKAPIAQIEEDITKAEWVSTSEIDSHLVNTYPTIVDVFNSLSQE